MIYLTFSNCSSSQKYEVEKKFADTVASKQILIHNGGHINSEIGYDTFEDIVSYI